MAPSVLTAVASTVILGFGPFPRIAGQDRLSIIRGARGRAGRWDSARSVVIGMRMKHRKHREDAMRLSTKGVMLGLIAVVGIWCPEIARSEVITIFLNQATASGVRELTAGFEKATGHKVNVSFQGGPALNQKIVSNSPGDLASLGLDQFDAYVKQGQVVAGSVVEYARVGNGVAVKAGAPKPDISTPEGFTRAMLDAKSIGHTNNGTGP